MMNKKLKSCHIILLTFIMIILVGSLTFLLSLVKNSWNINFYNIIDAIFIILIVIYIIYILVKKILKCHEINKKVKNIFLIIIIIIFIILSIKPTNLNKILYSSIGAKISGFDSKEVYSATIDGYNKYKNFIFDVPYFHKLSKKQLEQIHYIYVKNMKPNDYKVSDFRKLNNQTSIYIDFKSDNGKTIDFSNIHVYRISNLRYKNVIVESWTDIKNCKLENLKIYKSQIMPRFSGTLEIISSEKFYIDFSKKIHLAHKEGEEREFYNARIAGLNIKDIINKNINLTIYDKHGNIKLSGELEEHDKLIFVFNQKIFMNINVIENL